MGEINQETINAWTELAKTFTPEALKAIGQTAEFGDRQLDNAWRIAQLGEEGANTRAGISAGASRAASQASAAASRYSADASTRNAKIAAEASKYGIDVNRLTDQEKIALERQLGLGGLGVDLVKTAAGLSGPENYLSYLSLLRGGRGLGGAPYFLGPLMGNGQLNGFEAPGGTPTPLTMDSILRGLGGAGGTGVTSDGGMMDADRQAQEFENRVGESLAGGIHQYAPGSLERLNPSELGLWGAAAGRKGWNVQDLMSTYARSGINQGSAFTA